MTTKKYLEELDVEGKTLVFHGNEKLQNDVLDDLMDSEMHYIREKMDYIRDFVKNYAIGFDHRGYIAPRLDFMSLQGFLEGLQDMDSGVPAFSDEDSAKYIGGLEQALKAYEEADEEEDEEEHDQLLENVEDAAEKAADALAAQLTADLSQCFDVNVQLDYFLNFYSTCRMEEEKTYYIKPEEGYTLYQDISYTKSFE